MSFLNDNYQVLFPASSAEISYKLVEIALIYVMNTYHIRY